MFVRFVDTFTVDDHPELLAISGGEAFLRPALLQRPRRARGPRRLQDRGPVGHVLGEGPPDPAADQARDRRAGPLLLQPRRLPRARGQAGPTSTARSTRCSPRARTSACTSSAWTPTTPTSSSAPRRSASASTTACRCSSTASARAAAPRSGTRTSAPEPSDEPSPCALAAWPLVAFDGTVVACGNEDVVDGPAPAHLRLGHANVDGWPADPRALADVGTCSARSARSAPSTSLARHGSATIVCNGYCQTCRQFSDDPGFVERASRTYMDTPVRRAHGGAGLRDGAPRGREPASCAGSRWARYADLVTLGAPVEVAS